MENDNRDNERQLQGHFIAMRISRRDEIYGLSLSLLSLRQIAIRVADGHRARPLQRVSVYAIGGADIFQIFLIRVK